MIRPVRTVAPASEPITTAEAKAWMWVDHSHDDTLISSMVTAAIAHLDGWTGILGRCLITQIWRQDFAEWSGALRLPFPDVASVEVKYSDTTNTDQTVSSSLYQLLEDERGVLVRFGDSFASPSLYDDRQDRVRITLVTGFGDASAVPEPIKTAIKMLVAHWYANREAVGAQNMVELPNGVHSLIAPYRRARI